MSARNDQIAADYNGGLSLAECAQRHGMSKQNVHRILKERSDVTLRPANGWTEKTRNLRRGAISVRRTRSDPAKGGNGAP